MPRKKRNTWTDEHGEMIRQYNETTDDITRNKLLTKLIPKINEFIEVIVQKYAKLYHWEEKRDLYADLLLFCIDRFPLITDYTKADGYLYFILRNQMISLSKKKEVQLRREEKYIAEQKDYSEPFEYEIVETKVTREDIIERFRKGTSRFRQKRIVNISQTIEEWLMTTETFDVEEMLLYLKEKQPGFNTRELYNYTFRADLPINLKYALGTKKVVDILG